MATAFRPLMSRIGYLLNRTAVQIRHRAQAKLKPLGLIPPHIAVLSTLKTEGPQTQRELGKILKIDPTTMVWLIDDLEKRKVLRRGVHPKDRRAHLVELTAKGEALFGRAVQLLDHLEVEFLAPLAAKESEELRRLLTKLFRSVSTQEIPPQLFKKGTHA